MSAIMLPAFFDGEQIRLDEPYELQPNTRLVVTVVTPQEDEEREDWLRFAQQNLESAYGPDEPEYTLDDIKESNQKALADSHIK